MPRSASSADSLFKPVRGRWAKVCVAAALSCVLTTGTVGCGAARRTAMRPVTRVMRAVPGMSRFAPAPAPPARVLHRSAPPTIAPPPAATPHRNMEQEWELSPPDLGNPYELSPTDPPPAPNPLPGGAGQPIPLNPTPGPMPIERPVTPSGDEPAVTPDPAEGIAPPPLPADPSAYYPVGISRDSMSSLFKALPKLPRLPLPGRADPAAENARLVSHERSEKPVGKAWKTTLAKLGDPLKPMTALFRGND
ncbi:MAG: hypothetical protein AAF907_11385 [Planctomycetota bacterium]